MLICIVVILIVILIRHPSLDGFNRNVFPQNGRIRYTIKRYRYFIVTRIFDFYNANMLNLDYFLPRGTVPLTPLGPVPFGCAGTVPTGRAGTGLGRAGTVPMSFTGYD
jgi:hypothetical protein